MDMETWIKLLGKSQDDPAVKAALTAAGVKKIPKLDKDGFRVFLDLKGHGLWLEMTDEAFLKKLKDQDIGEGPLILFCVEAILEHRKIRDLYKGHLPYKLVAGMSQDDLRKTLGPPTSIIDDIPADIWMRDGLEVNVNYTHGLKLERLSVSLPRTP